MARKLPWLSTTGKGPKSDSKATTPVTKRRRISPHQDEENDNDEAYSSSVDRSKATSRPPRPLTSNSTSPPKEEYMQEGYDTDDAWLMVEDEFLTTAKLFTSHLHQAEYERLERLALRQNEGTIKSLSRPVDGRTQMSVEVRKKLEAGKQREKSRVAIANVYGTEKAETDDDEDDPWLKDPRLAGLMRPTINAAPLGRIAGTASVKTRASEGYRESRKAAVRRPFDLAQVGRSPSPLIESPVSQKQTRSTGIKDKDGDGDGDENQNEDDEQDVQGYMRDRQKNRVGEAPRRLGGRLDVLSGNDKEVVIVPPVRHCPERSEYVSRTSTQERELRTRLPARLGQGPERVVWKSRADAPSSDSPLPENLNSDDFDTFPLQRYHPNKVSALSHAASNGTKKKEEKKDRTLKVEDVPTFLF